MSISNSDLTYCCIHIIFALYIYASYSYYNYNSSCRFNGDYNGKKLEFVIMYFNFINTLFFSKLVYDINTKLIYNPNKKYVSFLENRVSELEIKLNEVKTPIKILSKLIKEIDEEYSEEDSEEDSSSNEDNEDSKENSDKDSEEDSNEEEYKKLLIAINSNIH